MQHHKQYLLTLLGVLSVLYYCEGFSVGIPPTRSICKKMVPGHDKYKPQKTEAPYRVVPDVTSVKGGEIVDVVLRATGEEPFQGFYLQARDKSNKPIGSFTPNTLAKTHSCGGIRRNAAHHANAEPKTFLTVSWKAPTNYKGPITFMASFVQTYVTFWTQVKADEPVQVI